MKEEARGDGDGTPSKGLTRGVLTRRKGEKIRRLGREAVRSEIVPIATKRLVLNLMNGMMNEEQV